MSKEYQIATPECLSCNQLTFCLFSSITPVTFCTSYFNIQIISQLPPSQPFFWPLLIQVIPLRHKRNWEFLFPSAEKSPCLSLSCQQRSPCTINNCLLSKPKVPWGHAGNTRHLWGSSRLPRLNSHALSLPCGWVTQGMGCWMDSSESATWKPFNMKWQGWIRGQGWIRMTLWYCLKL